LSFDDQIDAAISKLKATTTREPGSLCVGVAPSIVENASA
jgi:hypothetical protein